MNLLKTITQLNEYVDLKNSDASDAGKNDVADKAASSGDISFSLMRNTINTDGTVSGSEVSNYLERAAELNDEVDTVPFGLETDDDKIVKVYVNAEQADAFEDALKQLLGVEDDIEEAINRLATEFDIIDVVWPKDDSDTVDPEAPVDPDADLSITDSGLTDDEDDDLEVIADLDAASPETDTATSEVTDIEGDTTEDAEVDPEATDDEEDNDPDAVDTDDDSDEETEDGKPKKKKTDKEPKQESTMSIGSKFLQRVLAEAEDTDGIHDGFDIPLDAQARILASKLKRTYEKKLVALFFMAGVPGRYMNTSDVEDSISAAADMLRKQVSTRRALDTFYSGLAIAKGFNIPVDTAVQEAQARGSFTQRLFEAVLVALGLPEEFVTTAGPAVIGTGLFRTAELIEQDSTLEHTLRQLAVRLGVKANDAVEEERKTRTIKLWKKRKDGVIGMKELSNTMFSSEDDFQAALDHFYSEGYFDTRKEAEEAGSVKEALDVGQDPYVNAAVSLMVALGVPENILATRKQVLVSELNKRKMKLKNKPRVMQFIEKLSNELAQVNGQPAQDEEE